jgi:predicted MPP superfamily phosphohydrolase
VTEPDVPEERPAEERARRRDIRGGAVRALRGTPAFVGRWALRFALPIAGAAAMLHAFPYRATVQDVPFTVEGSLFTRPGLSADTTLGSWEFPDLTGLPIGVHITPRDVDLLKLTQAAGGDRAAFGQRLQSDFADLLPKIIAWLAADVLIGVLLGLLAAAAVNMSIRYLRRAPRRAHELRLRLVQLGGALGVVVLVGVYGWVTYNPDWARQSQLTGTLAAAQLFPAQLSQYYAQNNKAFDVLGSVLGIQAALQQQIETEAPATALRIMFISDMHLAANYPLVQVYARSYDVDLIVNTGDESLFGTGIELTPGYLDALRAVTSQTPMLWLAGNHDSPAVENTMRAIPGVTVLGGKTQAPDGYDVSAGAVDAFGLTIAGVPDPRVYGGPGDYGSDDDSVTDPLEREAMQDALADIAGDGSDEATASSSSSSSPSASPSASSGAPADGSDGAADDESFDIFATHEPVAAAELRDLLPDRIRETVAGHLHEQNAPDDIQDGSQIDLVEGSTGAGGLSDIVRGDDRPRIEFSIESVAPDCQFTRIVRFRIDSSTPTATSSTEATTPQAFGDDVTASTIYFTRQDIDADRTCSRDLGVSEERPL